MPNYTFTHPIITNGRPRPLDYVETLAVNLVDAESALKAANDNPDIMESDYNAVYHARTAAWNALHDNCRIAAKSDPLTVEFQMTSMMTMEYFNLHYGWAARFRKYITTE